MTTFRWVWLALSPQSFPEQGIFPINSEKFLEKSKKIILELMPWDHHMLVFWPPTAQHPRKNTQKSGWWLRDPDPTIANFCHFFRVCGNLFSFSGFFSIRRAHDPIGTRFLSQKTRFRTQVSGFGSHFRNSKKVPKFQKNPKYVQIPAWERLCKWT